MARKTKVPSPEKPPKRKMTQAEQSELFIKTARELGVLVTGVEFDRAFAKVLLFIEITGHSRRGNKTARPPRPRRPPGWPRAPEKAGSGSSNPVSSWWPQAFRVSCRDSAGRQTPQHQPFGAMARLARW